MPHKIRIMKTVKLSVFAVGVALSVTPIYHSAYAQSGNDSATMLLEMQRMRAEIAELRDMVERQQFEMKKLKRSLSQSDAAQVGGPQGAALPGGNFPNTGSPNNSFPNVGTHNGNATQVNPRLTQQAPRYGGASGRVFDGGQQGNVGTNARDYNPQDGNQQYSANQTASTQAQSTPNNGVEVVDLSVNSNPQVQQGSTEIVERGIEGYVAPGNAPVLSSDPNFPAGGQAAVNQPVLSVPGGPVATNQGPINASGLPTPPAGQAPAEFTEDEFYDRGFEFLKQAKYDDAIEVFKRQLSQHPQGELADDAHYWIAEAMFINRKPAEAKPHLRAIIDNYPQSARLPDAMLKTAYIEQDLGNLIEARIMLQEIVARHPSSNAAIAAKNRLENLKSAN